MLSTGFPWDEDPNDSIELCPSCGEQLVLTDDGAKCESCGREIDNSGDEPPERDREAYCPYDR